MVCSKWFIKHISQTITEIITLIQYSIQDSNFLTLKQKPLTPVIIMITSVKNGAY